MAAAACSAWTDSFRVAVVGATGLVGETNNHRPRRARLPVVATCTRLPGNPILGPQRELPRGASYPGAGAGGFRFRALRLRAVFRRGAGVARVTRHGPWRPATSPSAGTCPGPGGDVPSPARDGAQAGGDGAQPQQGRRPRPAGTTPSQQGRRPAPAGTVAQPSKGPAPPWRLPSWSSGPPNRLNDAREAGISRLWPGWEPDMNPEFASSCSGGITIETRGATDGSAGAGGGCSPAEMTAACGVRDPMITATRCRPPRSRC